MATLEITETSKKKCLAIHDGFQYRKHRINKKNITSWLCINERTENCRGTLKSKDAIVLQVSNHVCKPNVAATEVKQRLCNARKRARLEDKAIPSIYREEMQPLFSKGYEFVTDIPLFSSVKSSLYQARRTAQGEERDPRTAAEINLSEEVIRMQDGTSFLIDDVGEENRMLVFASEDGKKALKNYNHFFVDGTFKSASNQFCQLYPIHVDIGCSTDEVNVIAAAHALLSRKNRSTYDRLFSILKNEAGWNPKTVMMDFEEAAIIALRSTFPSVNINGCNFHFTQSLWRHIQEVGLTGEYKDDEDVRMHLRMCAALAHLPVEDIDDGWFCIMEDSPQNRKLQCFYDYFVDQWLQNSVITTYMWNCHRKLHRTNNVVEGWHHKLNNLINRPHPKIRNLVKCLKEEAEYNGFLSKRADLKLKGKTRLKKYIGLDRGITRILDDYDVARPHDSNALKKCLKALAYVGKFE